jgi:epoxide hydrolase-like predicted phosphatase
MSSSKEKPVVLLDYGRIVAPEDGASVVETIYGAKPDDQHLMDYFMTLTPDLALGAIDEEKVKEMLEARGLEVPADYQQRRERFILTHLAPDPEMVKFIEELKSREYTVALLSNIWPVTKRVISENGWYDYFDYVFLSCDEKMAKPHKEFYDLAMSKLNVAPSEIVFVDDKARNLVYPESIGMGTIHASDPRSAVQLLRQYLDI